MSKMKGEMENEMMNDFKRSSGSTFTDSSSKKSDQISKVLKPKKIKKPSFGMMIEEDNVESSEILDRKKTIQGNLVATGNMKEKKDITIFKSAFTNITSESTKNKSKTQRFIKEIEGPIKKFFSTICQEVDNHFLSTIEIVIEVLLKMKQKSEECYLESLKIFIIKFILDNLGSWDQNKVKTVLF